MILFKMSSPSGSLSNQPSTKATHWSVFLIGFSFLIICLSMCSCSTTKAIPVETIKEVTKTDTIYLNTFRFDSTYVSHDLLTDRSHDTILIKESNTEIRYKILRDTIERVKIEVVRDSIPYEVRIETFKEVPRPRTWFDHLCQSSFFLLLGAILYIAYRTIRKFF